MKLREKKKEMVVTWLLFLYWILYFFNYWLFYEKSLCSVKKIKKRLWKGRELKLKLIHFEERCFFNIAIVDWSNLRLTFCQIRFILGSIAWGWLGSDRRKTLENSATSRNFGKGTRWCWVPLEVARKRRTNELWPTRSTRATT